MATRAMARHLQWATLMLLLVCPLVRADFPTEYLPAGPRPRLWITSDHLAGLQLSRSLNTPQWQRFYDEAQDYLADIPWNGPQYAVPYMALMYLLTGQQAYADRAVDLMEMTSLNPGDDHAKSHWTYLALGYDWLYDNPAMTEPIRTALAGKLAAWSDYVWQNYDDQGTGGSGMDSDAVIGSGANHLAIGCALYGDHAAAGDILDRGWWMWQRGKGSTDPSEEQWLQAQPIRRWLRDAQGGHFYVGMLYFSGNDAYMLAWYWLTLKTACQYDVQVLEPGLAPFWANAIQTVIHLTDPPRQRIHHTSDWQDPNTWEHIAWFHRLMAYLTYMADRVGARDWAAVGRGYDQSVTQAYYADPFGEFFFHDCRAAVVDPYSAGLATVRLAGGQDYLFFRDSWNIQSRWGLLSGQGGEPVDHQNPDTGHFVLWREDDFLTRDARCYSGSLDFNLPYNTLAVENGWPRGSAKMSGFEQPASVTRFIGGGQEPAFAYAMVCADGQYNDDPNAWQPNLNVLTCRRHFFWSRDYVVVLDRLRTADPAWSKYRIRSLTQPQRDGTTISQLSPNGSHKLLHRTLEPADAQFLLVDESVEWQGVIEDWEIPYEERAFQHEISPDGETSSVNYLHALQMGPAAMTDFDSLEHIADSQNCGVRLGDWCVVMAREEALRSEVSYSISEAPASLQHLVTDLVPGRYTIRINGQVTAERPAGFTAHALRFATTRTGGLSVNLTRAPWNGDVTRDGCVTDADIRAVIVDWLESDGPAELNGDQQVNSRDLALVLSFFHTPCGCRPTAITP